MVETQNTTMLNKEIKYNSSPTLTTTYRLLWPLKWSAMKRPYWLRA